MSFIERAANHGVDIDVRNMKLVPLEPLLNATRDTQLEEVINANVVTIDHVDFDKDQIVTVLNMDFLDSDVNQSPLYSVEMLKELAYGTSQQSDSLFDDGLSQHGSLSSSVPRRKTFLYIPNVCSSHMFTKGMSKSNQRTIVARHLLASMILSERCVFTLRPQEKIKALYEDALVCCSMIIATLRGCKVDIILYPRQEERYVTLTIASSDMNYYGLMESKVDGLSLTRGEEEDIEEVVNKLDPIAYPSFLVSLFAQSLLYIRDHPRFLRRVATFSLSVKDMQDRNKADGSIENIWSMYSVVGQEKVKTVMFSATFFFIGLWTDALVYTSSQLEVTDK